VVVTPLTAPSVPTAIAGPVGLPAVQDAVAGWSFTRTRMLTMPKATGFPSESVKEAPRTTCVAVLELWLSNFVIESAD